MSHIPDEMLRCPQCRGEVVARILQEIVGALRWDDLNEEFTYQYEKEHTTDDLSVVIECKGCGKRWKDHGQFRNELYQSYESVTLRVSTEAIEKEFGKYASSSWIIKDEGRLPVEMYKCRHSEKGEYFTLLSQGTVNWVRGRIESLCGGVVIDPKTEWK